MLLDESLHLLQAAFFAFIGGFGGVYAFRTLKLLYGNPEMLKSQRIIWMPILVAGGLLSISGTFHLSEHFFSAPEMNLVSEFALLAGLSFLALGIFRYWSLQKGYDETKRVALRKIKSP